MFVSMCMDRDKNTDVVGTDIDADIDTDTDTGTDTDQDTDKAVIRTGPLNLENNKF
jgi:hypothetical protein